MSAVASTGPEIVQTIFDRVAARTIESIGELLAEDVTMHLPFQVPGLAAHAQGREAVLGFLRSSGIFDSFRLTITSCRRLANGDDLLVLYTGESTMRGTGRPYRNSYVALFGFRNGLLASWVEYFDPLVLCAALGLDPATGRPAAHA